MIDSVVGGMNLNCKPFDPEIRPLERSTMNKTNGVTCEVG